LHLFVVIPPHIAVSDFVQRAKGRSSRKVQQEFPELKTIYWGRRFWGRGYFSATSGHITDEVINEYINKHQPHYISRLWDNSTHKKLDKDVFRLSLGNLKEAYLEVAERLSVKLV
jgi:hypothetical protein